MFSKFLNVVVNNNNNNNNNYNIDNDNNNNNNNNNNDNDNNNNNNNNNNNIFLHKNLSKVVFLLLFNCNDIVQLSVSLSFLHVFF